jgi:hypothetical protein
MSVSAGTERVDVLLRQFVVDALQRRSPAAVNRAISGFPEYCPSSEEYDAPLPATTKSPLSVSATKTPVSASRPSKDPVVPNVKWNAV